MSRHRIAQRISLLEQTFGCRVEDLTPAQSEARNESNRNQVRTFATSRECFQEGNESLAELFARSLGMSCRELKAALKVHASALPNSPRRCTPGGRRG